MNDHANKPAKTIFYQIILTLFIVIGMFLVAIITVNPEEGLSKCIWDSRDYHIEIGTEDEPTVGYTEFSEIDNYLKSFLLSYIDVPFGDEMELVNRKDLPIKKIFIVDEITNHYFYPELVDNKIYLTDYIVDKILNYNPQPLFTQKSYEDFIGQDIFFSGHYLEVGGVFRTGYSGSLYQEKGSIFENYYETAFMTKNTLDTLFSFENIAPDISFYGKENKYNSLFYRLDVKVVFDNTLEGNEVTLSQDLANQITVNSFEVSKLQFYLFNSFLYRCTFDTDIDIKGVISDENVKNTIHISDSKKEDIYQNNKGFSFEFWIPGHESMFPTEHLQVIADELLTGNDILVSKDITASGSVDLVMSSYWRYPHYWTNCNVVGTIEDEGIDEATIYVSQTVYDNFVGTVLQGGIITNPRYNQNQFKELVQSLRAYDMYFQTPYKDAFIKLVKFGPKSIPLFIIIFVIYLVTLISYMNQKIKETKNTHFSGLVIITADTCFTSYFIALFLFILLHVNKIIEKIYYEHLQMNLGLTILLGVIFPLLAFLITILYLTLTIKRKNKVFATIQSE